MISSMKKNNKKSISKWIKFIITTVVAVLAGMTIVASINWNSNNTIVNESIDNSTVINGDIYNGTTYVDDKCLGNSYEQEVPYTVRETYLSARSGEEGKDYKLVSVDTRMGSDMKWYTYYTYDVTYY